MKRKKYFSLIELLLVMFISAIMLGIVIPTFHKVTKGVSVEMAARQIGAQLKAVREYAITNREYVALIMEPSDAVSPQLPQGYKLIAYRPCIVSSSHVFQEWVFGERWEFLPEGSQIEMMSNFNINPDITGVLDASIGLTSSTISNVPVFSPTGKCEGVSGSGATVTVSDVTGLDTADKKNKVNITVAGYTGRVSYGSD
jgi:type II secretory pathway pseudopilin PulG